MKAIFLILIFALFVDCIRSEEQLFPIIGRWQIVNDCITCSIFEFDHDNLLTIFEQSEASSYYYNLYPDNTIKIEYGALSGTYELEIYENDSIKILGFTISGIPEVFNTTLKRLE
jgi:hypothetical protein